MIHEIVNFIEYLEDKSPDIFSENLELKEGIFLFLEEENGELIIKDENILKVDKKTEKTQLYDKFKEYYSVSEMIRGKSLNSLEKIFIEIGSPYAISISGKGHKIGILKKMQALEAYLKAIEKYLNKENVQQHKWFEDFKTFVRTKMFDYLKTLEEAQEPKDSFMFYFFMKEPEIKDYQEFYDKYLQTKVFLYDLKENETNGISNDLNVFNVKKAFLKHKSASFEINYKVSGQEAMKLYKFFRLQQKNKILPNPMPIFVDKDERKLSEQAITFYNSNKDKKFGHKEIIENLLEKKENLQNFYLIYFQNNLNGSRIIDLDFVPVFKHKFDNEMKIETFFQTSSNSIHFDKIETVFDFEELLNSKLFLQYQKKSDFGYGILKNNYFIEKIKPSKQYDIPAVTTLLLYKYRKAFYDFIYKSKHQLITDSMFHDLMKSSILDDIRHDEYDNKLKYHSKEKPIKEKLNIWFSLYNYFNNNSNKKNTDMANNIAKHRQQIIEVAEGKRNITDDEEFAFDAGQVIYYILSKSKSNDKSYSRLEPFLQKSNYIGFRKALLLAFNTYKHENFSNKFKNPFANVLDYIPDTNFKDLMPTFLAGFFSDNELFSDKKENDDNNTESNNN